MKKILSTILVLCVTLNLFIGVMPAFAEDETGILTVADFSNIETVKEAVAKDGNGNFSASIAETYNDAPVSLKWSVPSDRVATPGFKIENTDLSKYTHFRMRFYCTTPDEKFVVFASSKGEPDISVPHYYRVITATGNGWQEVSVPVTYFGSKSVDIDGVSTAPSWDNIGGVCLYTDFYSGAAATDTIGGHNIYIDKIWFENSNKTYASGTTDLKSGDISVFDVTSVADQNATDAGKFQLETVNAREGGNEAYLIRKINALTKETTTYNPSGTVDVSSMKYLNMWVYSPKATNGAFIVRTYSSSSDYKGYFREDKSIAERMLLDWEGWNLISIDLSDSWGGGSLK